MPPNLRNSITTVSGDEKMKIEDSYHSTERRHLVELGVLFFDASNAGAGECGKRGALKESFTLVLRPENRRFAGFQAASSGKVEF